MSKVFKQFNTEVRAVRPRVRQFTLSTATVDRDNDTIDQAGWHLDNYRRNPVILWAHRYDELPIGRAVDIHTEGNRLVADAEFADHDFADTVLRLVDGGFLRATSVGFRPITFVRNIERGGVDFKEQELLEFSVVPVPANADAVRHLKAAGLWRDDVVLELDDDGPTYSYDEIAAAYVALAQEHRRAPADPLIDPAMRQHVRDLMRGVVREAVGQIARDATTAAIAKLRGQVD